MFIWVRFGERLYGHVDEDDYGEHANTTFFHVWYLPIIPLRSWWFKQGKAHPIALHGKSIASVYLRLWAVIAALLAVATGTVAGFVVAGALAALSAWSWTWRRRPAAHRRRGDLDGQAFGLRCGADRLSDAHRAQSKVLLEARWEQRGGGRSPEDVATHGARSADEAVLAYGLLRLAALERGGADGAAANAAADAVMRGDFDPKDGAGPYREAAAPGAPDAPADAAREQEIVDRMRLAAVNASMRAREPRPMNTKLAVGLLSACTASAIAIAAALALPVLSVRHATAADLTTWNAGELIAVDCVKVEYGPHVPVTDRDEDPAAVRSDTQCELIGDASGKMLAVTWQHQEPRPSFTGVIEVGAPRDPYAAPFYPVHVRVDDKVFNHLAGATFALIVALALWVGFAIRRGRHARAAGRR
jgi:hypothetical protein|nr:hypothetical protein [Kofleriaceae bacterium]